MRVWQLKVVVTIAVFAPGVDARAQGELVGKVFAEGETPAPIVAARVEVQGTSISALSDSGGRFRLSSVASGIQPIVVRAVGFLPDTVNLTFEDGLTIFRDFVLKRQTTTLAEVRVEGEEDELVPAKLVGFYERRRSGVGRFLDRAEIAKFENRRTGDMLRMVPGITVRVGSNSKAWATNGRGSASNQGAFQREDLKEVLDRYDILAGAKLACYMDVYVDGTLVYNSTARQAPLFDVNSIPPEQIEAIEVYAGAAQIPAMFNRTSGGCGAMIIWTRIG